MAILSTIKDFMLYLKESTGYVLYRLSAKCVAMDNGNDLQTEINTINNNLTVNEYQISDFAFQTFYQILEFQCWKIGRMVFINCGWYVNPGTILLANNVYGLIYSSVPSEIKPNNNVSLQGFACNGDWGEATQISVYLNVNNGIIEYSTPSVKSYYKLSGFWLVD